MGVSSGDYPAMADLECIYRDQDVPCDDVSEGSSGGGGLSKAPVLHFGSVFRKPMFPNMVGECFVCYMFFHICDCFSMTGLCIARLLIPHLIVFSLASSNISF